MLIHTHNITAIDILYTIIVVVVVTFLCVTGVFYLKSDSKGAGGNVRGYNVAKYGKSESEIKYENYRRYRRG